MIDYKICKKDLKKGKNQKIIVTIWESYKKKYYIITTLQAIEDYQKLGFLAYDKSSNYKKTLIKILKKES